MITESQLNEFISTTMKNMPLPPIEDILSIPCESDFDTNCIVEFIHKYYSTEDVLKGLNAHLKHCKFVVELFESKK